ncbi:MAG: hypothetical protein K2O88_09310 [Paramuribaculum sp.]|nr:hypothetical protein [Paramuribaculum sp.]
MTGFDFWAVLLSGVLLFTGGITGVYGDYRKKKVWWRWVLDVVSTIIGVYLLVALCY